MMIYGNISKLKNRILQLEIIRSRPQCLSVFTTNRCNFSCYYCSRNISDDKAGVMHRYDNKSDFCLSDLKILLDKYPSIKIVSFVGVGEPFLNSELILMARYAKQNKKQVLTISNGSLLHNHWGDIASLFDEISISLHGLNAEELNRIAKASEKVYTQFLENVKYLTTEEKKLNSSLNIRASVVGLKSDLNRIIRAADFCRENHIQTLDIHNYLPVNMVDSKDCFFDDDLAYIEFFEKLKSNFAQQVIINAPVLIHKNQNKISYSCPEFFNTLRVDGVGQVAGCTKIMIPKKDNGNWRSDEDVWNNAYFLDMRRRFREKNGIPECCQYCPRAQ